MKMTLASRAMNFFILALAFELPGLAAGGLLRGLVYRPSSLQPLQRPPPATADAVFAQMAGEAPAPAPAPAAAPGPAPVTAEPPPPKITEDTCKALKGKVAQLIGAAGTGGPGPAPAPASTSLLQAGEDASGEDKPTVECKIYAYISGQAAGCSCYLEAPPPPAPPPKVSGCPLIQGAFKMGFTGGPVTLGPMAFGGQTGGWTRHTCIYRQWFFDPAAEGKQQAYQISLNDARAEKYIKDTYAAALNNAHNTASAFWALTPVPWLKLYPTTPMPMPMMGPGPAPAPGPGTTPYILNGYDYMTTPSPFGMPFGGMPFGMTTPRPGFGAMPGMPGMAGGVPGMPGMAGAVTPPTFQVVR